MKSLLEGVRVLDFTQALSGPFATMLLGDLGADVIKVEPPTGDDSRGWGPPFVGDMSTYFISLNRNKSSVVLDLKTAVGREVAQSLARASEVVIENFRPGTAAKLGIDRDTIHHLNSSVVYCSITGFGQDDERPGYDQIVQGEAGLMSVTGFPDGPPTKVGIPVADISAGAAAAQAILAALFDRARTGRGHAIDIAMQDALLSFMGIHASSYLHSGDLPGRMGNHHASIAPYGTFQCADRPLNICVGNDRQWRRLCEVIERSEWLDDKRYQTNASRVQARTQLRDDLEAVLARRSATDWKIRLEAHGVPVGEIKDLSEVFADPSGGNFIEMPSAWGRMLAGPPPWQFGGDLPGPRKPPPALGADTERVLRQVLGDHTLPSAAEVGDQKHSDDVRV